MILLLVVEKGLFVVYDCLNKAESSDIDNSDEWLLGCSYYISGLYLNLDKFAFYTVNTFFPINKDDGDGFFALAYDLAIAPKTRNLKLENSKTFSSFRVFEFLARKLYGCNFYFMVLKMIL